MECLFGRARIFHPDYRSALINHSANRSDSSERPAVNLASSTLPALSNAAWLMDYPSPFWI